MTNHKIKKIKKQKKSQLDFDFEDKSIDNTKANTSYLNEFLKDSLLATPVIEKTIVFVGKTKNGKSTVINTIEDVTTINQESGIFSITTTAHVKDLYMEIDNIKYIIHCMDTPGLKEIKSINSKEKQREDEIIEDLISDCANLNILKIDIVFITIRLGNSVDLAEFEVLSTLSKLFKEAQNNFCLLLTNCENKNDIDKEKFVDDLFNHPNFQHFKKLFTKDNIFFAGAITNSNIISTMPTQFKEYMKNIQRMRYKLLKKIITTSNPVEVKKFDSFRERQKMIDNSIRQLSDLQVDYIRGKNRNEFTSTYDRLKGLLRYLTASERYEFNKYEDIYKNPEKYTLVYITKN